MKIRMGFWFLLTAVVLLHAPLWAQSGASLLATTDLDCTWKLDGAPQGSLQADGSMIVPISLGQHLVQATSTDGKRKWRAIVTITVPQQEVVDIKLADSQQQETSRQPEQQQETHRQPAKHQQPVAEPGLPEVSTWSDPATGRMWEGTDNGANVTWKQAGDYCSNLKLAGYSDWRLPTLDELSSIYDKKHDVNGWHIKGGIRVSGRVWSSEDSKGSGEPRYFNYADAKHSAILIDFSRRALCVRRAGK